MTVKKLLQMATVLLLASFTAVPGPAKEVIQPLRLLEMISIPDIMGRLGHMDVDVAGQRLFLSALENGSVEVIDLKVSTAG